MSTTAPDPLAALAALPGVADAVDSVRKAVDRVYGHRVMRRRGTEVTAEAALRGARGSAALSGADWNLEEVRRRTDFSGEADARTVGAALRLTAEAGQLLSIWRQSPMRVLARLHLVASGGAAPDGTVGRPRLAGEPVDEPLIAVSCACDASDYEGFPVRRNFSVDPGRVRLPAVYEPQLVTSAACSVPPGCPSLPKEKRSYSAC